MTHVQPTLCGGMLHDVAIIFSWLFAFNLGPCGAIFMGKIWHVNMIYYVIFNTGSIVSLNLNILLFPYPYMLHRGWEKNKISLFPYPYTLYVT